MSTGIKISRRLTDEQCGRLRQDIIQRVERLVYDIDHVPAYIEYGEALTLKIVVTLSTDPNRRFDAGAKPPPDADHYVHLEITTSRRECM